MTEHEPDHVHLEIETGAPKAPKEYKNQPAWILAGGLVLGALIIAGSIVFGFHALVKNQLAFGGQALLAANQAAPAAVGAAQPTQAPGAPVTVADRANEPTLGSKNAKVTMVEFGDFQCPFCKQYYQQSYAQIKSQYIDTGKVKLIFRHFPLSTIHVNAQISAVAAECANQQGKFWEYHDKLYTDGQSDGAGLDKASLEKYASSLGLNSGTFGFGKNKFNQCLEGNATLSVVNADQAEGTKDGVTGTPTFYINGVQVVGAQPLTAFQAAIDKALKQ
jgi:protein-disulfide isomerase